jgi:hypothetical protein
LTSTLTFSFHIEYAAVGRHGGDPEDPNIVKVKSVGRGDSRPRIIMETNEKVKKKLDF